MATEKRLIRLADLMKFPIRINHYDKVNGNEHFVLGIESVLEYAENLPTVDAVEVVHGRWIDRYGGKFANPLYECSECKKRAPYKFEDDSLHIGLWLQDLTDYCHNCGAKMDGDKNV